ncbi:MAG TPA: hypothetical protein VF680_16945 [Allosphingosinicella sp.]|jgi:bacterioferritin (cytochrome b1)
MKTYTKEEVKEMFLELFQETKHGDQEHQDWLENKIKDFINDKLNS